MSELAGLQSSYGRTLSQILSIWGSYGINLTNHCFIKPLESPPMLMVVKWNSPGICSNMIFRSTSLAETYHSTESNKLHWLRLVRVIGMIHICSPPRHPLPSKQARQSVWHIQAGTNSYGWIERLLISCRRGENFSRSTQR